MSKKRTISDHNIIDIIQRDIKEMDSDNLEALIEHMYPVKATYNPETELVEIVVEQSQVGVSVEEIFGETNSKLFEDE